MVGLIFVPNCALLCRHLLLVFTLAIICIGSGSSLLKPISFSANGYWGALTDETMGTNETLCKIRMMCTPSNLTWIPNYTKRFLDNNTACDALIKKGITKIYFHGDSYMRQIYAAMLITLNGNYRSGSLANETRSPDCIYHRQFDEKRCNTRELNHYGVVCGGKIILDPIIAGLGDLNLCSSSKGSVVLWSFGNYKLVRYGRAGVNNATMYSELFERDTCKHIKDPKNLQRTTGAVPIGEGVCSIWWVSTHYRLRAIYDDEKPDLVREYNLGMRKFFEEGKRCGPVNYIDVYNMTADLAMNHNAEALRMTYDQVHWGIEVNLQKAQIILNALLSAE